MIQKPPIFMIVLTNISNEPIFVSVIKAALWWTVNSYHNYIKEKEFILHGTTRISTAFTDVKKYRLVDA